MALSNGIHVTDDQCGKRHHVPAHCGAPVRSKHNTPTWYQQGRWTCRKHRAIRYDLCVTSCNHWFHKECLWKHIRSSTQRMTTEWTPRRRTLRVRSVAILCTCSACTWRILENPWSTCRWTRKRSPSSTSTPSDTDVSFLLDD